MDQRVARGTWTKGGIGIQPWTSEWQKACGQKGGIGIRPWTSEWQEARGQRVGQVFSHVLASGKRHVDKRWDWYSAMDQRVARGTWTKGGIGIQPWTSEWQEACGQSKKYAFLMSDSKSETTKLVSTIHEAFGYLCQCIDLGMGYVAGE